MRDNIDTPESTLLKPDSISLPQELINWGRFCIDCGTKFVVYEIAEPGPGFEKRGPLCLNCLATRCGAAKRIPYPMEEGLLDQVQLKLGILPGPKRFFLFPKVPELGGGK